jgi:hypothetical protein
MPTRPWCVGYKDIDTTPLRRIACRCSGKRVWVLDAFTVALSELRVANLVYALLVEVPMRRRIRMLARTDQPCERHEGCMGNGWAREGRAKTEISCEYARCPSCWGSGLSEKAPRTIIALACERVE